MVFKNWELEELEKGGGAVKYISDLRRLLKDECPQYFKKLRLSTSTHHYAVLFAYK